VRISHDRGLTYAWTGRLTPRRPVRPAAVLLYDAEGTAQALAVDLDVSRGGREQVRADSARLCQLLDRAGARYLVDQSPSGGRHVWVPLARRRTAAELLRVTRALALLLPSLDPTPITNAATGCLRPPGSAHPSGGHQELLTPWARAVDAVRSRTGSAAWTILLDLLAPQLKYWVAARTRSTTAPGASPGLDERATARAGGARPLPAPYAAIAHTGQHDAGRYRSPSEARMAVLASAAAHGWSRADVTAALADGEWPGLAGLYARYAAAHRAAALGRDWAKALPYARCLVAISDTGELPSHPPAEAAHEAQPLARQRALSDYVHVRVWRTAVDLATHERWADRAGQSKRAVLSALAEAAHRRGSRYIDVGCRSLGLGAALDHATTADVLRALREETDPFLVLLEDQRGERGDLYELRVPDAYRDDAESLPWRAGRLSGLHPVFHQLGVPAAHLYEAIGAVGRADVAMLVQVSHLSRATVYRAAALLASHGLITRSGGRWRRTRLRLDALARRLGVPALIDALLTRIRAERVQWRALLGLSRNLGAPDPLTVLAELAAVPPPPEPPPDLRLDPWDQQMSPIELLHHVLGAVPIPSP
jgi:hypothetical protein